MGYRNRRGNQYSTDISNAIQSGANSADNDARNAVLIQANKAKQESDYIQALQTQRNYEMRKEKQDYDMSKAALDQLSENFPIGDKDAEIKLQNFQLQQPEAYRELVTHIKKGMPWAVVDGQIRRIPKYKVLQDQLQHEKDSLEQRVNDGTASEEEKLSYVRSKAMLDIHKRAEKLVTTGSNADKFDKANPSEQSDMISQEADVIMRSLLDTLGAQGQLPNPVEQQSQPTQNPMSSALANIGKFFQGNKPTPQQGEVPVESNQQSSISERLRQFS